MVSAAGIEHAIDVLVSKNSGGPLTAGKLAAARQLGIPINAQARLPRRNRRGRRAAGILVRDWVPVASRIRSSAR